MRRRKAGFQADLLMRAVAVGRVGPDCVRLWLRTDAPGPHRLLLGLSGSAPREFVFEAMPAEEDDGTWAIDFPGDFPNAARLEPLTRYAFSILSASGELGSGRFETAPAPGASMPERAVFATASCHQPFDEKGRVRPDAITMLKGCDRLLDEEDVRLLLLNGDQMYSDKPDCCSLFEREYFAQVAPSGRRRIEDCSPAEVRRLFQDRYRRFWSLPAWKALQSRRSTCLMVDDHDLADNWGSVAEHTTPMWSAFIEGARAAAFDYQLLRSMPRRADRADFHYGLDYGSVGVFVLDLRSQRRPGPQGQVLGASQWSAFDAWLDAHRSASALLIVTSVPLGYAPVSALAFLSRLAPDANDIDDRWSHPQFVAERDRFLRRLYEHQRAAPHQRVVLLAGDVHVGYVHELRWEDDRVPAFHQLTSSSLTNRSPRLEWKAASLVPRLRSRMEVSGAPAIGFSLVRGLPGRRQNPVADLNLGLVELSGFEGRPALRFRLASLGRDGRAEIRFESEVL